jgi:hypothetical protein
MSFPRHKGIYRSDGRTRSGCAAPGADRVDESPAGYSLAGCAPAEPTSASPAITSMRQYGWISYHFPVNGNSSLFHASHRKGSLQ